jgi:hypothetical protein
LYDNARDVDGEWLRDPSAAKILRAELGRMLAPAEAVEWLGDYGQTFLEAADRPGYLGPATIPAYRLLEQDAAALIPVAATVSGVNARALRRAAADRRAALARADLP